MRIKCRIDSQNPGHTRFTVFQDGGNCGQLCMDTEAAELFFDILEAQSCLLIWAMCNGSEKFEFELDNEIRKMFWDGQPYKGV